MPWCRLFGGTLPVKSRSSGKPSPHNDDSVDGCGGMLGVQAATVLAPGAKSMLQEWMVLDVAKLTKGRRGKGKKAGGGAWSRRPQNDVSAGRNARSFRRRCAGGLMDSGGLGVALPCASAKRSRSFLKFLMTARMLVAGSLLVIGPAPGS